VAQVGCLYDAGVRHFRLGRQPNFFHYQRQNVSALERLLVGIRVRCPDLRMLHIDNVNIVNVVNRNGSRFASLVAQYCTSGNVAPFGIESFDPAVREATGVVGTVDDVLRAIEIINEQGAARGEVGVPRFLPGINLIHGLPGATERTHELNQRALAEILARGLMTYRFYYRNITEPIGVSLHERNVQANVEEFARCFEEMVRDFVLPMQSRVYPEGSVILGDWEAVRRRGVTVARTLGTCSIKVEIEGSLLTSQRRMAVRVRGNLGYRMLSGSVM
jgi:radical SAM superfamily enzyme with C-terminal helix-hairpin-helix motif